MKRNRLFITFVFIKLLLSITFSLSIPNTQPLHKANAIVVGASSGIGRAVAKKLATNGYNVGIVARRLNLLESLKDEILQENTNAQVYIKQIDVTQTEQAQAKLTKLIQEMGKLDLELIRKLFCAYERLLTVLF